MVHVALFKNILRLIDNSSANTEQLPGRSVRKQEELFQTNVTLLSKIKCHVISNQYKRRPLPHVRVAITSHPRHGLVKRVTSAFPTNKMIMKVDLGQNVRLVVSLWRFVVSSFRHVVSSFHHGVSSFRHADF